MNVRTATWDRLNNTSLEDCSNVVEAMDKAGLNWAVEKRPLTIWKSQDQINREYYEAKEAALEAEKKSAKLMGMEEPTIYTGDIIPQAGIIAPGVQVCGRVYSEPEYKDRFDILGVVGDNYQIIQNFQAFSFVDGLIPEGLKFVKAGMTSTGMAYIIAKLPERYILDDRFDPYVIMQNSFNGRYSCCSCITPLRYVCQNQFSLSFKNSKNKVTIRHSKNADNRLEAAQVLLKGVAKHMEVLDLQANLLACKEVSDRQLHSTLEKFFPMSEDMGKRSMENVMERRQAFLSAYSTDDNANFMGTRWGLVNAYSDYITHPIIQRETPNGAESRFLTTALDPTAMDKFVDFVVDMD